MENIKGKLRKARIEDVEEIHTILSRPANEGKILPRTRMDIYGYLRDFYLYVTEEDEIVGIAALHICWENLAELRSVVVREEYRKTGIGRKLVDICLDEAVLLGLTRVFVLTYRPDFFSYFGFEIVEKSELPQKVWMDCVHCVHFPKCDEKAMVLDLEG
jgi:amino-acid N-acetyltransferase